MPRIGVITGTRREARCLRHQTGSGPLDVACSGADAAWARVQADSLVAAGCGALLSFGVAGGLDPALAPGTIVIAESVILPNGGVIETDGPWRAALVSDMRRADIPVAIGAVLGVEQPVSGPEPKRLLFTGTAALAVDMESHAVMQAARRGGIPGLVVRAIADGAGDELPEIAMVATGRRGETRYLALAAALFRQPLDLAGLLRLARVSRPAFASLRRVAALPGLGGPL